MEKTGEIPAAGIATPTNATRPEVTTPTVSQLNNTEYNSSYQWKLPMVQVVRPKPEAKSEYQREFVWKKEPPSSNPPTPTPPTDVSRPPSSAQLSISRANTPAKTPEPRMIEEVIPQPEQTTVGPPASAKHNGGFAAEPENFNVAAERFLQTSAGNSVKRGDDRWQNTLRKDNERKESVLASSLGENKNVVALEARRLSKKSRCYSMYSLRDQLKTTEAADDLTNPLTSEYNREFVNWNEYGHAAREENYAARDKGSHTLRRRGSWSAPLPEPLRWLGSLEIGSKSNVPEKLQPTVTDSKSIRGPTRPVTSAEYRDYRDLDDYVLDSKDSRPEKNNYYNTSESRDSAYTSSSSYRNFDSNKSNGTIRQTDKYYDDRQDRDYDYDTRSVASSRRREPDYVSDRSRDFAYDDFRRGQDYDDRRSERAYDNHRSERSYDGRRGERTYDRRGERVYDDHRDERVYSDHRDERVYSERDYDDRRNERTYGDRRNERTYDDYRNERTYDDRQRDRGRTYDDRPKIYDDRKDDQLYDDRAREQYYDSRRREQDYDSRSRDRISQLLEEDRYVERTVSGYNRFSERGSQSGHSRNTSYSSQTSSLQKGVSSRPLSPVHLRSSVSSVSSVSSPSMPSTPLESESNDLGWRNMHKEELYNHPRKGPYVDEDEDRIRLNSKRQQHSSPPDNYRGSSAQRGRQSYSAPGRSPLSSRSFASSPSPTRSPMTSSAYTSRPESRTSISSHSTSIEEESAVLTDILKSAENDLLKSLSEQRSVFRGITVPAKTSTKNSVKTATRNSVKTATVKTATPKTAKTSTKSTTTKTTRTPGPPSGTGLKKSALEKIKNPLSSLTSKKGHKPASSVSSISSVGSYNSSNLDDRDRQQRFSDARKALNQARLQVEQMLELVNNGKFDGKFDM